MMQLADNLYKHLALWGVVLLIFSLVYPFSQVHRFNLDSYEGRVQAAIDLKAKDNLMVQRQTLADELGADAGNDLRLADIDEVLVLVTAQIDARVDLVDYQLYIIGLYTKFGLAGALLGLISAVIGFRLWYVRIQKPLDVYLREHQLCQCE